MIAHSPWGTFRTCYFRHSAILPDSHCSAAFKLFNVPHLAASLHIFHPPPVRWIHLRLRGPHSLNFNFALQNTRVGGLCMRWEPKNRDRRDWIFIFNIKRIIWHLLCRHWKFIMIGKVTATQTDPLLASGVLAYTWRVKSILSPKWVQRGH